MGEHVWAGDVDLWTEQVGQGSDVLLIGGLGDTVESWQYQLEGLADRYRLTAFDNRGAGRTAMPEGAISAGGMADDAAELLRGTRDAEGARRRVLDGKRHRAGAGPAASAARPQPLAREHLRSRGRPVSFAAAPLALVARGCAQRSRLLRGVLHVGLHTPRARGRIGGPDHRGSARLPASAVRRGVPGAGGRLSRAQHGRSPVEGRGAHAGPGRRARRDPAAPLRTRRRRRHPDAQFETLRDEAHQPFQEIPDEFNARRRLLATGGGPEQRPFRG